MAQKLKTINSKLKTEGGFTLVDLLVGIGLFAVVSSIALGGLARVLRTQRQVAALVAANNNASLALEQMARETRTGHLFCADDPVNGGGTVSLCPAGRDDVIAFINAKGDTVSYRLSGGAIERWVNSVGVFEPITGQNVLVQYLRFLLLGNVWNDGQQTRVTVAVGIGTRELGVSDAVVRLQTTISPRELDREI